MFDGSVIAPLFLALAIIFPLFWMAILWLIARLGGWRGLATQYRAEGPASGEAFSFVTARFGGYAKYGNCLNISVSSRGIHMQPFTLMQIAHEPLFLPWDAILSLDRERILGFSSVEMAIEDVEGGRATRLVLYGKDLADSLMRHAPQHLHLRDE